MTPKGFTDAGAADRVNAGTEASASLRRGAATAEAGQRPSSWSGCLALLACSLFSSMAGAADFPGFSVEPPGGEQWRLVQRNASSLVWMRRVPGDAVTFGVAVLTETLAAAFDEPRDFLEWTRRMKAENPDPKRFRLIHSQLTPAPEVATFCVRYETMIEDRSDTGPDPVVLELSVAGLACLHPAAPGRYYDIQYSSRHARDQNIPPSVVAEGRSFVDSLRFGPAPSDGRWALGHNAPVRFDRDAT